MDTSASHHDIDDPTNPATLVDDFGDFDVHGNRANESHSVIAWDAGRNAYAAAIDNEEVEDVDLFEITDPTNPTLIAETELPDVNVNAHGALKTFHDFDVLQFPDGTWHLMVSDWDAGWIDVDVTNPATPVIVGDFDYAACDAFVTTACPPEGNAHQGEWNSDGSVFVGTDEDFDAYRTTDLTRTTGDVNFPAPESYTTVGVGGAPVMILADKRLNGPVAYGGYGAPAPPIRSRTQTQRSRRDRSLRARSRSSSCSGDRGRRDRCLTILRTPSPRASLARKWTTRPTRAGTR